MPGPAKIIERRDMHTYNKIGLPIADDDKTSVPGTAAPGQRLADVIGGSSIAVSLLIGAALVYLAVRG